MRLVPNQSPRGGAAVAQVTFSESGGFGAVSAAERRDIPVFAPLGVSYRPRDGDNLLMISVGGADVCVGVLSVAGETEPGEVRIESAGGARIHLKNNGDLLLNGVTITRAGEILTPGG